jgi:hypothetical protein
MQWRGTSMELLVDGHVTYTGSFCEINSPSPIWLETPLGEIERQGESSRGLNVIFRTWLE